MVCLLGANIFFFRRRTEFSTGHSGIDGLFAKRRANAPVIERLATAGTKLDYCTEFAQLWRRHLSWIFVNESLLLEFRRALVTRAPNPQAQLEALITDATRLAETIEQAIDPSFVASSLVTASTFRGPRYAAVEFTHTCPKCRAGLPLNGPLLQVRCQQCRQTVEIGARFWDFLKHPDKNYLNGAAEARNINGTTNVSWSATRPACSGCGTLLPVDEVSVGATSPIHCPLCGRPTTTFPAPDWLQSVVPKVEQLYGAEGAPCTAGVIPLALNQSAVAPIGLACPQCGGGLTLTAESDRTVACGYCQAQVYLPDELYKQLHPVKLAHKWWVRYAPMW